ncbi:hypothetical protein Daus18300_000582 [Diaporthe australafricana]|uniref:Hsp70 family chaperone n=1 Tax=Diaporthe australafricana TaxID=127596 RepID=A0ABR3Y4J2_9PEZI
MITSSEQDLIIGIDLGMSSVAYFNLTKSKPSSLAAIRVMKRWEGRIQENKVPTVLVYDKSNIAGGPTSWGFKCDSETEQGRNRATAQWFKKSFAPKRPVNGTGVEAYEHELFEGCLPPTDTLYRDFLSKLHRHISSEFPESYFSNDATWATAHVEFVFSVPATWDNKHVNKFIKIAREAGFGEHENTPKHSIGPCLTEPQAAAVFATKEEEEAFKAGENVLIIDAGGGTADLCLLSISNNDSGGVDLSEIKPVEGEEIGSSYIDQSFQQLAFEKLKEIGHQRLQIDKRILRHCAWKMMISADFQHNKHDLGRQEYSVDDSFYVKIPVPLPSDGLAEVQNVTEDGHMRFSWGELMDMFVEQGDKLKQLINNMVDSLQLKPVSTTINHVYFSGGLGGSPYLIKLMTKEFNGSGALNSAHIHASSDPQLCVCKGLVMNRLERLQSGSCTFSKLCARTSLGILKHEKLSILKASHRKAKRENGHDVSKQQTVTAVDWVVLKGEPYDAERPISKDYQMRFPADVQQSKLHGYITIVSSGEEHPPRYYRPGDSIEEVAQVAYDFQGISEKNLHMRHAKWFDRAIGRKACQEINFVISAKLNAAEVNFECRT